MADRDSETDGYNAYDQEAGFLDDFTSEELDAIKQVTQKFLLPELDADLGTVENPEKFIYAEDIKEVAANYDAANTMDINDKMFLLNVKQLSAVYKNRETLGDEYYIGEPTAECVENSEYKPDDLAVGQKWSYWLRTPNQTEKAKTRYVDTDGRIRSTFPRSNMGIRPAFYLKQSAVNFKTGDGTADASYLIGEPVKIGDYVQMGMYYGKPIIWRCVDIDENGPLMLSDKILSVKVVDANGEDTKGSHKDWRSRFGSNFWPDSNICSWLNSTADAGKVEWLCGNPPDKDHVTDGYNAYDQEAGFLNGFVSEELDAIKKVTQKFLLPELDADLGTTENPEEFKYVDNITGVAANYDAANTMDINDKMFLLNVKQLSAVYENRETLGNEYYIGELTAECVENSEYKPDNLAVGQKWSYWLRTPHPGQQSQTRYVDTDGRIKSIYSMRNMGIRPAFYLKQSAVNFKTGDGTRNAPYSMQPVGVGDYVQMGTYYGKPIIWRCVDIDENGPLMLSDKILAIKAYDAAGPGTETNSHGVNRNRLKMGSSYWKESNMRSWLNSEADAGEVEWLCGNPSDADHLKAPYNAYDREAGFLHNFTQEERDAVKEVTQKEILCLSDQSHHTSGTELYTNAFNSDIKDAMSNYDKAYAEDVENFPSRRKAGVQRLQKRRHFGR